MIGTFTKPWLASNQKFGNFIRIFVFIKVISCHFLLGVEDCQTF